MKVSIYRSRFAAMLGNLLEHYDSALFGLVSPFIAPLFFSEQDPVTALILMYSMLPLGLISKPLGALFFGWIGDLLGKRDALFLSLTGMAIVTFAIGCLPLYKDIGFLSPLLLTLCRLCQGFFAAGEVPGGAIFVIEQTAYEKRSLASSCYDACSVGGAVIASFGVTLLSAQGLMEEGWRYLFWIGGCTAVLGIILRRLMPFEAKPISQLRIQLSLLRPFFSILCAAGFSYTTYTLAFTFMNGFVPLVTSFSKSEIMQMNTALLLCDLTFLWAMGYLATRFGKEQVMILGALSATLFAVPLFCLLDGASFGMVVAIRLAIVCFGTAFSAPYYAWAVEKLPSHHRYLILALAGSMGAQCIGMPTSAACLWLYKHYAWSGIPGLYLAGTGLLAALALFSMKNVKGHHVR